MKSPRPFVAAKQYCKKHGVVIFTRKHLRNLKRKGCVTWLGEGGQGSCQLLKVDKKEWVMKKCKSLSTQEINYMAELKPIPGVQQIVGVCPGNKQVVTQNAGKTVSQYIQDNYANVTPKTLLTIVGQLAWVVLNINAKGVFHNDLKLNNVCVKEEGVEGVNLTVIDFGLSSSYAPLYYNNCPHPSWQHQYKWIAPEVFLGHVSSEATEVYSIGHFIRSISALKYDLLSSFPMIRSWVEAALDPNPHVRPTITSLMYTVASYVR